MMPWNYENCWIILVWMRVLRSDLLPCFLLRLICNIQHDMQIFFRLWALLQKVKLFCHLTCLKLGTGYCCVIPHDHPKGSWNGIQIHFLMCMDCWLHWMPLKTHTLSFFKWGYLSPIFPKTPAFQTSNPKLIDPKMALYPLQETSVLAAVHAF